MENVSTVDGGELIAARESALLAPYALFSADSIGRAHAEPPHPYRGPFQRDRDRITHSFAFRRLSDTTQVFTGELGEYHRTRLTHTLEVASIARTIARALRVNEDFVEALALLHDIGHPPYGHAGEDILNECLADVGGFNHNAQALRIVELLELRYVGYPGLNLSREVLDGQCHRATRGGATPFLEVQIVDVADSIAYNSHDADDALEFGLITLDELIELTLWREARERVRDRISSDCDRATLRRALLHAIIDWQVGDVVRSTLQRIQVAGFQNTDAARAAPAVVLPSASVALGQTELKRFLYERVYRHPDVLAKREAGQREIRIMFRIFNNEPSRLPAAFQEMAARWGAARAVGDFLAGMTDRSARQVARDITREAV